MRAGNIYLEIKQKQEQYIILFLQAVCEWGRDSVESWGRKRRSITR